MKKTLLTFSLLASFYGVSQDLQTLDFNSLTIGNVGTDFGGNTSGQGSLFTFAGDGTAPTTTTNAGNSNFQIVASGNNSTNGFQMIGPDGDKGAKYMWLNGLNTAWAGRTSGNNKLEVEYDFFTGATSTSTNRAGVQLYNGAYNTLCGFLYNMDSGILQGIAYLNNNGTPGHFVIDLGPSNTDLVLSPNTWNRVGFGYDSATGQPYWKVGASATVTIANAFWQAPSSIAEIDFAFEAPSTNTSDATIVFDNYVARASATETLLLGNEGFDSENTISVKMYPNPAKDVLNIQSETQELTKVSITDLNGRVVKEVTNNLSQISLGNLAKGIYMVTIESATAKKVEKLIVE